MLVLCHVCILSSQCLITIANNFPADAARNSRPPRTHTGTSGSGSETEASIREGRPKIRIRNSPPTSPNGSRTGTPSGSRAQSPQRNKRAPFPPWRKSALRSLRMGSRLLSWLICSDRGCRGGRATSSRLLRMLESRTLSPRRLCGRRLRRLVLRKRLLRRERLEWTRWKLILRPLFDTTPRTTQKSLFPSPALSPRSSDAARLSATC